MHEDDAGRAEHLRAPGDGAPVITIRRAADGDGLRRVLEGASPSARLPSRHWSRRAWQVPPATAASRHRPRPAP